MRRRIPFAIFLTLILAMATRAPTNPNLRTYFKEYIRLSDDQIAGIRGGQAFAKNLHSRNADEIFVFGAVYIKATPEDYVKLARDFDRLRSFPGYLAIGQFSDPPRLSDLKALTLDSQDMKELQECKPGDCKIQLPASSIEEVHQSVDWSDPNAEQVLDEFVRKKMLEHVTAYQQQGNAVLGVYNDKRNPTLVPEQFKYMLSYSQALPKYLPDFYAYLLQYPAAKPPGAENSFYWARVKFGLKPTVRMVHVLTLRGDSDIAPAYVIAEKQIYSSHYFQTALDLTFCVRDDSDQKS